MIYLFSSIKKINCIQNKTEIKNNNKNEFSNNFVEADVICSTKCRLQPSSEHV